MIFTNQLKKINKVCTKAIHSSGGYENYCVFSGKTSYICFKTEKKQQFTYTLLYFSEIIFKSHPIKKNALFPTFRKTVK